MIERVSVIISLCISVVSMVIAILSYRLNAPIIRIHIDNMKSDCFFGNVRCENRSSNRKNRISGTRVRIVNGSKNDIAVMGVFLKIHDEIFRLIDKRNPYWEVVEFVFSDEHGEETTDGSALYYNDEGIELPVTIKAYSGLDFVALFHDFPFRIKKSTRATMIVQTAVGAIRKKIKMVEYNLQYTSREHIEVMQYFRSTDDGK